MKKTVPVIGSLDDKGEAKPWPGVKIAGAGQRFIDCPACGARLDKTDLAGLLEHEEGCPGSGAVDALNSGLNAKGPT